MTKAMRPEGMACDGADLAGTALRAGLILARGQAGSAASLRRFIQERRRENAMAIPHKIKAEDDGSGMARVVPTTIPVPS